MAGWSWPSTGRSASQHFSMTAGRVDGGDVAPNVLGGVQGARVLGSADTVGEVAGVVGDDQHRSARRKRLPCAEKGSPARGLRELQVDDHHEIEPGGEIEGGRVGAEPGERRGIAEPLLAEVPGLADRFGREVDTGDLPSPPDQLAVRERRFAGSEG